MTVTGNLRVEWRAGRRRRPLDTPSPHRPKGLRRDRDLLVTKQAEVPDVLRRTPVLPPAATTVGRVVGRSILQMSAEVTSLSEPTGPHP
jgi:hypothetical protein